MNITFFLKPALLLTAITLVGCSGNDYPPPQAIRYTPAQTTTTYRPSTPAATTQVSQPKLSSLYRSIRVRNDILPKGAKGRTNKSMRPLYITIHSTQNWSKGADADRHSLALQRGALGRVSWHYTVDESKAIQHLPTNEQGNHAENYKEGPGNRYSIGIEMCEHPGNSRAATVDKTARLAAYLMHKYKLPLSRVVPHYKWPRKGYDQPNKNCPHFLMDSERPGRKWNGFLRKVDSYYKSSYTSRASA